MTMTEALKKAIADSGMPTLRISDESGVARASLIRFIDGKRSLRLDMADKLATYFELELTKRRRK